MQSNAVTILCASLFMALSLVWPSYDTEAQTSPGRWITFVETDSAVVIQADTATIRSLIRYLADSAVSADSSIAAGTGVTITSQGRIKILSATGVTLAQVSATLDSGTVRIVALAKQISDSLNSIPRQQGGISSDSVKRLGREFIYHGFFAPVTATDTSLGQAFGSKTYGTWLSGRFVSGHAHVPLIVRSIIIQHVFDSTFSTYAHRDTLHVFSERDSIPAGAAIGFGYLSAQSWLFQYIQAIRVLYTPINTTSTTVAGEQVQLPLILGVPAYNRGLRHGTHAVSVTLLCVEKVPGRIY